jgi:hypothetical protein
MQRGRAYEEATRLGERYPVYYSEDDRVVKVQSYPFPQGWDPRMGRLLYRLPSNYPTDMPTVYVPAGSRYEGRSPLHQLRHSQPPGDADGEWAKWCIEEHRTGWDPAEDTLLKLTQMMRASLTHPDTDNPLEELDRAEA